MILRHERRKSASRHGSPGRERPPETRGTDIILIMMASVLVLACTLKILVG